MKYMSVRTRCPIGLTLDVVGDKWSLLIIRNILFADVHTYKNFAEFQEKIATNILANRLERLEKAEIICKLPDLSDGRKSRYVLTEKGVDLMPMLLEMINWGMKYHPGATYPEAAVTRAVKRKHQLIEDARKVAL